MPDRRDALRRGAASMVALVPLGTLLSAPARAAGTDALTIAYDAAIPGWDPTSGPASVDPALQSVWKAVFDHYIDHRPNLAFAPGLLTRWGWNADKTRIALEVRQGAFWHDGKPVTAADVVWSLKRAADPKSGNPIGSLIWSSLENVKSDGNRVTADVSRYVADLFKWMAHLTGYVLPQHYFEKVGAAGFEKQPVGSGPYRVKDFVHGSYVRLAAFERYWGPKPAFREVTIKFVTRPSARVAEIETGSSDLTLALPLEDFDRLRVTPGLAGIAAPTSEIAMVFINDVDPFLDPDVRKAAVHAIDKHALVKQLLRGYGVAVDTLQAPHYAAFDPTIKVAHDPDLARALLAKAGYGRQKPVEFTIQTTRGFRPKDYETVREIVRLWRAVGIFANIEVYEIAKHYELRAQDKLAPMAFYDWNDAIGDPNESTGLAMYGPSPHSAWKSKVLDAMIGPLWDEKDETKRIAGWKAVDRYIADNALVLPLYQRLQTVVFRTALKFAPHGAGYVLPQAIGRA